MPQVITIWKIMEMPPRSNALNTLCEKIDWFCQITGSGGRGKVRCILLPSHSLWYSLTVSRRPSLTLSLSSIVFGEGWGNEFTSTSRQANICFVCSFAGVFYEQQQPSTACRPPTLWRKKRKTAGCNISGCVLFNVMDDNGRNYFDWVVEWRWCLP